MPPIIFLAAIMCSTAVVMTAITLISRHISQRRVSSQALSNDEIAQRLERIELAVDASAIEVKRLAESNRFVAKLLADKTDALRP